MIKHFVVMSSAYSIGKRIALDYCDDDILQMDVIQKDIDFIYDKCGKDAPISTHFIQTEERGWDKVIELDKFFENTKLLSSKEEFVDLILKDLSLKGIDIAKYILTKVPCTHLKLQKLVYMCYADYICKYGKKLFNDTIYAYKLGPVISSVYKEYKKSGYGYLAVEDDTETYNEETKKMPIRSRILSSSDGLNKIMSIDKTLEKYAKYDAKYLVDLTHQEQTPWSKSGAGNKRNQEIKDDIIIQYHKFEVL
jgi:uncharacterized phage-associated protein